MASYYLNYRDRVNVKLPYDPRCGVCNCCRAVYGEVDAQRHTISQRQFHIHHEEYDDNDVLAHTMEVCPSCHRKIDNIKRSCYKLMRYTDPRYYRNG